MRDNRHLTPKILGQSYANNAFPGWEPLPRAEAAHWCGRGPRKAVSRERTGSAPCIDPFLPERTEGGTEWLASHLTPRERVSGAHPAERKLDRGWILYPKSPQEFSFFKNEQKKTQSCFLMIFP